MSSKDNFKMLKQSLEDEFAVVNKEMDARKEQCWERRKKGQC